MVARSPNQLDFKTLIAPGDDNSIYQRANDLCRLRLEFGSGQGEMEIGNALTIEVPQRRV